MRWLTFAVSKRGDLPLSHGCDGGGTSTEEEKEKDAAVAG